MKETYRNLVKLTTEFTRAMTPEQIAEDYKEELNPILFATAYCKMYKFAAQYSAKFPLLKNEDVVSYTLERLDFCLQTYDGSTKFITYFSKCLYNEFRAQAQALCNYKNKIHNDLESYEELTEESNYEVVSVDKYSETLELTNLLDSMELSSIERKYCDLLVENFGSNKEIAEKLKINLTVLYQMRRGLQEKFTALAI